MSETVSMEAYAALLKKYRDLEEKQSKLDRKKDPGEIELKKEDFKKMTNEEIFKETSKKHTSKTILRTNEIILDTEFLRRDNIEFMKKQNQHIYTYTFNIKQEPNTMIKNLRLVRKCSIDDDISLSIGGQQIERIHDLFNMRKVLLKEYSELDNELDDEYSVPIYALLKGIPYIQYHEINIVMHSTCSFNRFTIDYYNIISEPLDDSSLIGTAGETLIRQVQQYREHNILPIDTIILHKRTDKVGLDFVNKDRPMNKLIFTAMLYIDAKTFIDTSDVPHYIPVCFEAKLSYKMGNTYVYKFDNPIDFSDLGKTLYIDNFDKIDYQEFFDIYVINYNTLRIMNGMGGLAFAY